MFIPRGSSSPNFSVTGLRVPILHASVYFAAFGHRVKNVEEPSLYPVSCSPSSFVEHRGCRQFVK